MFADASELLCVSEAVVIAVALSLDLSVLVTPLAVTVTEQVRSAPAEAVGMLQEWDELFEVTVSEVCAIPLMRML